MKALKDFILESISKSDLKLIKPLIKKQTLESFVKEYFEIDEVDEETISELEEEQDVCYLFGFEDEDTAITDFLKWYEKNKNVVVKPEYEESDEGFDISFELDGQDVCVVVCPE